MELTVGITTKNRPVALRRCVSSVVRCLPDAHIIVFDDGSDVPAEIQLTDGAVRVLRDAAAPGYIAGRNAIVAASVTALVLLLDDDAVIIEREAVEQAAAVIEGDPTIAAVGFAQAEADGRPWPAVMQPARGERPMYVACFIGFAHMLRRDVFLSLEGYRSEFVFYGEEKDYCLRLLEAGYRTVYLPGARIAHIPDMAGRDPRRYVRYAMRNDCLGSLYNHPWPLAAAGVVLRFWRFTRMARGIPGGDPGGLRWLATEVRRAVPGLRARRRPVSWRTVRHWWRLSRSAEPYAGTAHD